MFRAGSAFFLMSFVFVVHAQPELAQVLIDEAYQAYLEGNHTAARTLARRSLDLYADYGDPHILLALSTPLSSAQKLLLAEAALSARQMIRVPSHLAVRLRARILLYRDEFQQLADFLGVREETLFHADLTAWRIHALLALGRRQEAQNLLQAAQSRHPSATELVPYLIRMSQRFPEWESRVNAQLQREGWWTANKRMVLELLPLESPARAAVLRFLQRRLPDDPDVAGLLTSMRILPWEDAFSVWERSGLPRDLVQTQSLGNLVPPALRGRWQNLVTSQSGVFYLGSKPLSFNAERRRYEQGRLLELVQDLDGDEENDQTWSLAAGRPLSWRARVYQVEGQGRGDWELVWKTYPVVERIVWNRDSERGSLRRVFEFIPDAVRLADPVLEGQLGFPGNSPRALSFPSLEGILQQAIRISDYDPQGRLRRRFRLANGQVYLVEEDRMGRGRRDTVVLLRGGRIDRVWRDIEGSGRWNLYQRYSDGLPQELLFAAPTGRTEFLWRGIDEGLFLIGEPQSEAVWPLWQQGLAQLRLQEWTSERPPAVMPVFPRAPFDDLGEWK